MYIPSRRSVLLDWVVVGFTVLFLAKSVVEVTQDVSLRSSILLLSAAILLPWAVKVALRKKAVYVGTKQYHPLRRNIMKRFDQLLGRRESVALRHNNAESLVLLRKGPWYFRVRVIFHVTRDDADNILDASQPRFVSFQSYYFGPPIVASVIKRTDEAMLDNDGNFLPSGFDTSADASIWSEYRTIKKLSEANLLEADLAELRSLTYALDEWDVEREGDLP